MDSVSFQGFVLDPAQCSKLSMEEKRELVYEVSEWSQGAPELLQSWSRQEILQILCAEMGKERKYTGLTKLKIIEHLLKVVSEKRSRENKLMTDLKSQSSGATGQRASKRPRKTDHPNRLMVAANSASFSIADGDVGNAMFCKNSACRAKLSQEDSFCKRCSCCVCYQYDDNKDPSLWLTCSSDAPFQGNSCGMSCHLECALRDERSGITKEGQSRGLDGSFYCVSCRKVNDLLGCWRKQMITARDTRRVDILCYRVSLGQKLLNDTECYQKLYDIVDEAMQKLEADVGPLTGLPVKKARGIVNRIASGHEVQRLCAFAVESLDSILSNASFRTSCNPAAQDPDLLVPVIGYENVGPSSLTVVLGSEDSSARNVVYSFWHRKADAMDYPAEPTCTLFAPSTRFLLSGLTPATQYFLKVVLFESARELGMREVQFQTLASDDYVVSNPVILDEERSHSPATNSSSHSNPSSVEDENNNVITYKNENEKQKDNEKRGDSLSMLDEAAMPNDISFRNSEAVNLVNEPSPEGPTVEDVSTDNGSNALLQNSKERDTFAGASETALPVTPCKMESFKDVLKRKVRPELSNKDLVDGPVREEEQQDGSSSKKRGGEREDEECAENGERDFGYYVKVIRWLECGGHIEASFRQKFLTWYSLRASSQEMRIVKVFVDTLIEDPASLAGQLIDTFSEVISNKRCSVVPAGFCLRLWH